MRSDGRPWFLRRLLLFVLLSGLIVHVARDAIFGAHGLIMKHQLEARIAGLETEIAKLKGERTELERDANRLGSDAAKDPALLDEEARAILDFAKPTDIVIVDDAPDAP
jgi:cell division protein FtsB